MSGYRNCPLPKYIFAVLAVLVSCEIAWTADLGCDGAVYPIAEPDHLAETEARAREIDWSKVLSQKKTAAAVKTHRPEGVRPLPRAKKVSVVQVDMTYTLEMDIPDGKGGILYPKGFTYDPLDYMPAYPFTLVVIDGADPLQVDWLRQSTYLKDTATKILLTGGSVLDLSRELGREVFYIHPRMQERLKLAAAPSVVRQAGKKMEVREVAVGTALVKTRRP